MDGGAPVREDVDLAALALHVEVVRKLALEPLGALAVAEELAHNRLGVHACTAKKGRSANDRLGDTSVIPENKRSDARNPPPQQFFHNSLCKTHTSTSEGMAIQQIHRQYQLANLIAFNIVTMGSGGYDSKVRKVR